MLESYLKCKQIELEKMATECRSKHYCKIIGIYSAEMESSTKAVQLSGEIIQETYYLLCAHQLLTNEMDVKMNQLSKAHDGQRGVRFINGIDDANTKHDNDDDDILHTQNIDDITLDNGLDLIDGENDEAIFAIPLAPSSKIHAKRALNVDETPITMPKRFAATDSSVLNATRVLETHSDDDENGHGVRPIVSIGKPSFKSSGKRPMPVSRALKETNTNVHKDYLVPKSAVKAMINGRPVTLREKENKRFLTVVGKSPRRNSPSASSKSKFSLKVSCITNINQSNCSARR